MSPPRQDRRVTKVLAALHNHGGPGRSPLYRWMRRHHDSLAAAFAETSPAWAPLAAEMAAVGLTDAGGKAPSAVSARQTWYRVRRDLARARELKRAMTPGLAPDEIAPGVHAVPLDDGGEPLAHGGAVSAGWSEDAVETAGEGCVGRGECHAD